MTETHVSDTQTRVSVDNREIILIGTAHVSRESAEEVEAVITQEKPGRVCVEIDQGRYKTMTEGQSWTSLNIGQVIKQGKGFLLLTNLVMSSFQRRLGVGLGTTPGEEMKQAVAIAEREGIPFSFVDRDVQTTLRRAWGKTGFWGKNKLMAALLGSVFSREKLSEEDIERLKKKSALQEMMDELATYLPSVKEVLIDERDRFLASKIFECREDKIVAVVGAGHVPGIVEWFGKLEKSEETPETSEIETIPPKSAVSRILPWVIPAVVLGIIGFGFVHSGWRDAVSMLWMWILVNGTLSAVGALIALAHPLTIVLSFVAAPITSMNPTIGVGLFTGVLEGFLRKPRVIDFEHLNDDITSLRGFYRNRVTHTLVVFFLSSLGSSIGTFIGIPFLASLLGA